jgi:hypothetical protein
MRNHKLFLIAAVALLACLSVQSQAQVPFYEKMIAGVPVSKVVTAVSTDVAMVVKYVGGASGGGEVAVAAGGDITLTVGGAADTTTECPVSGAYGGVIDVSDASCDTLGEVCDAINFSANWRCIILDGLRSDSSNDTLATISATNADSKDGLKLYWDTAVALRMTQTLVPSGASIDFYIGNGKTDPPIIPNPFKDHQMALYYFSETSAHTLNTINIYAVKESYAKGALNAAGTGFVGGSETVDATFQAAGGATGTESHWDFRSAPFLAPKGDKLIVRVTTTGSLTAPTLISWGSYFVPPTGQ